MRIIKDENKRPRILILFYGTIETTNWVIEEKPTSTQLLNCIEQSLYTLRIEKMSSIGSMQIEQEDQKSQFTQRIVPMRIHFVFTCQPLNIYRCYFWTRPLVMIKCLSIIEIPTFKRVGIILNFIFFHIVIDGYKLFSN